MTDHLGRARIGAGVALILLLISSPSCLSPTSALPTTLSNDLPLPSDWDVASAALADVTGDGLPEWVLLVWRPWRDWPIQRWSSLPSPIADFHDAAGRSCHLILLDPAAGRELWAGSALPVPFLALAVRDVDGDGRNELVALEGTYAAGRFGPATYVDIWRWNGFGFSLEGRFPTPAILFDGPRNR
ncbi:MAG: hypothetical protein ACP5OO_09185 [Chloroflexia bacterium]